MDKSLLNRINQAFNQNLKLEDLNKPNFLYYTGYIEKGKPDETGHRLGIDAVIIINGLKRQVIGIRAYKLHEDFKQETLYLKFWKEKSDKIYSELYHRTEGIIETFNKILAVQKQKENLICKGVYLRY